MGVLQEGWGNRQEGSGSSCLSNEDTGLRKGEHLLKVTQRSKAELGKFSDCHGFMVTPLICRLEGGSHPHASS
jgi:hypothetical protein